MIKYDDSDDGANGNGDKDEPANMLSCEYQPAIHYGVSDTSHPTSLFSETGWKQ